MAVEPKFSDEANCSLPVPGVRDVNGVRGVRAVRRLRPGLAMLIAPGLLWGAGLCPAFAASSIVDALNAERARGCEGRPGVAEPMREDERLRDAAEKSPPAKGHSLDVLSGFRAVRWSVLRIRGPQDAGAVAAAVRKMSCGRLLDPEFRAVGIHHAGRQSTIVFAVPYTPPPPGSESAVAERVLQLVNEARSQPRQCGDKSMPVAGPVRFNDVLAKVARAYSEDMAQHSYMAHQGRDGSMVNDRVNRSGYRWRSVGENLASGQSTPEQAVEGWLKSPGHCATLMGGQFLEMGLGYAFNPDSRAGMYWTQLFARPR